MNIALKDERGGVTVVVAALVAGLLLVGSIALVVDSGVVYLERRTVANAAQSSTLALAKECIESPTTCFNSPLTQQFANANSPDGLTSITEICIDGFTVAKMACKSVSGTSIDCSPVPSTVKKYVRVRTESLSSEVGVGIRTFFSTNDSERLQACAQARWGNAGSAMTYTPFAVSICEWAKQQSLPRTLKEYKTNDGVSTCTYSFVDMSGRTFTRSGIDGWAALDLGSESIPLSARAIAECPNPATDEPAYLRIGYELSQITRSQSSTNYCGDTNLASKMSNWIDRELYIPLVSTRKISGASTVHRIEAFATYRLLGYALLKGNGSASDIGGTVPKGNWCPKNTSCIYGEFVSTTSPDSEISDDPSAPQIGLQALELF